MRNPRHHLTESELSHREHRLKQFRLILTAAAALDLVILFIFQDWRAVTSVAFPILIPLAMAIALTYQREMRLNLGQLYPNEIEALPQPAQLQEQVRYSHRAKWNYLFVGVHFVALGALQYQFKLLTLSAQIPYELLFIVGGVVFLLLANQNQWRARLGEVQLEMVKLRDGQLATA